MKNSENPDKCDVCNETFSSVAYLKKQKSVTKSFKSLTQVQNLMDTLQKELSLKMYRTLNYIFKCDICDKSFSWRLYQNRLKKKD